MDAHNSSVVALSKETVDAAKPQDNRYILWDRRLKGFGLDHGALPGLDNLRQDVCVGA